MKIYLLKIDDVNETALRTKITFVYAHTIIVDRLELRKTHSQ